MPSQEMRRAAEARKKGLDEQRATYVAALESERRGYHQRGDTARASEVDVEIAALIGDPAPPVTKGRRKS